MSDDACSHAKDTETSRQSMPDESTIGDLADFFKVFSDSTRVKILLTLDVNEMCVCDISEALGMTMSAVSHQLRVLKDARLVTSRKDGRTVYYRLCDEHVKIVLDTALEHIVEGPENRSP